MDGRHLPRDLRAKNGRPPRNDFADFVDTLPRPDRLLGLTHITTAYTARDIVEAGAIGAENACPVIGETLTYTFFGKAAFRASTEFIPTQLSSLFPVALVIDPTKAPAPKYVFGFDSGAFVGGKFDSHLHPYMPLFDFLLAPNVSSAGRLISAVFSDYQSFFENKPSANFDVPTSNFEAKCYKSIVLSSAGGNSALDDRRLTPEVIFCDPLEIRKCVAASVLPDTLAADAQIGGKLRDAGVEILQYPWKSSSYPIENHATIMRLFESINRDRGWM